MPLSSRFARLFVVSCLVGTVATFVASSGQTSERETRTLATLVLHQDKAQSVPAFQKQIGENGFAKAFPPEGVEVVSWRGSVDLGHVITLRLPPHKVPEVRQIVESREWGDIEPRLYTTYDFEPFWEDMGGETHRISCDCDEYGDGTKRMLIAP